MLYCSWCANWNAWPVQENKTHGVGKCEYCKRQGILNFAPTAELGTPKELPADMLTPASLRERKPQRAKPGIIQPNRKIIRPS